MNSNEIIAIYEDVASITSAMVASARTGNWAQLAALESRCSSQVSLLRQGETPVPLSGDLREKKIQIIRKILADDKEIRNLTEPWMEQLQWKIKGVSTEKKVARAYGL
ncbi:MAG: fliT [Massilia sp.]|jgi:flagellar protein FliT|nr:fliT [Massilia sp.]MDB5909256.1 fliT [Massilia sp.]